MKKVKILISIMLILLVFSCKKTEDVNNLNINTVEIDSIMINSALSGGIIENIDKLTILEVGVCWDTISLPTVICNKTVESVKNVPIFEFKSILKGLSPSKEYYVRAYAKTNNEVFYGNQQKFSTISKDSLFIDFDYKLNQNFAPCKVTIINNSKFANSFSWNFEGAIIVSSDKLIPTNIEYNNGGTFTISLTGCSDKICKTFSKTVVIENSNIEFKDQALEKRIRTALNIPNGTISKSLAKTITKLVLSKPKNDTACIRNIEELKYFTSLKELYLSNNLINDISSISNLTNLEILDLYNNNVFDLLLLEKLINLKVLNLWDNRLTDISALSKLVKMVDLNIGANLIMDISPIKGITSITSLWLNANAYTVDTITIKSLSNIKTLGVTSCKLNSIYFVKDLINLEDLLFENNSITDITALKNFSKLRSLYCGYNNIKDFKVLENLYNNGCFRLSPRFTYHIGITNNGIDATSGTENRRVIDLMTANSVKISWQTGNTY